MPFRIGLIGAGRQGRQLSRAARAAGDCALVACADPDPAAAAQTRRECSFQHAYHDHTAMLAEQALDGVLVATPHALLAPAARAAIAAGCHVFVEKPAGVNAKEARELVLAAQGAGVTLMPGYCMRYTPVRLALKALVDDGAIGDIVFVSAGKGGLPLAGWLADAHLGGGQLLYLGSHITDQVLWVVGRLPTQVSGTVRYAPDTGIDTTSAFTVTFDGGAIAQVVCSHEVGAIYDFLDLYGTRGRVRAEWPANTLWVRSTVVRAYQEPTVIQCTADPFSPMYVAEVGEFVAAARAGRPPAIPGEAVVSVLEVLDAVKESSRRGGAVELR